MSDAIMAPRAARPQGGVFHRLALLATSFIWALEMSRRCQREIPTGQPMDDETIRRITREVDAWAADRAR